MPSCPSSRTARSIFIGATTENPAFALNNALLSRARVYVLKPLADQDLVAILSARASRSGAGARRTADQSLAKPNCSTWPAAPMVTRDGR